MIALVALVTVLRVVDGDTLHVRDHGDDVTIRVLGLDCPEAHRNLVCRKHGDAECEAELPRGMKAAARARESLPFGAEVELVDGKGSRIDRWRRRVTGVRVGKMDFAATMIREGLCSVWKRERRGD